MAASPGGVPSSPAVIRNLHLEDQVGILCFHFTKDGEVPKIEKHHFVDGFRDLKMSFTDLTLGDLYEKVRRHSGAGVDGLTGDEMAKIRDLYPTLFSVMVCRVLDMTMDSRQKEELTREETILNELQTTYNSLSQSVQGVTDTASGLQENSLASRIQLEASESAVSAHRNALQDAHSKTIRTKDELAKSISTLNIKEHEHSDYCKSIGLDPFMDDVKSCKQKCEQSEAEIAEAEDKIRRLEELLSTLHSDLEARKSKDKQLKSAFTEADNKLTDKLQECGSSKGALDAADEDVKNKQRELDDCQKEEQLCGDLLQSAMDSYKRISNEHDAARDDYNNTKEHLNAKEVELQLAQQSRDNQISKLDELKAANRSFNNLRDANYEKEDELLVQEVRLKEQRDCLELKEAQLRSQVVDMNPNLSTYAPVHLSAAPFMAAAGTPIRTSAPSPHPNRFSGTPTPSPAKPAPLPGRM